MILKVTHVDVMDPYVLDITFNDGTQRRVNVKPYLVGVHARLRDPHEFAKARVEYGTVVWPSPHRTHPDKPHHTDLDFAPEAFKELPELEAV